MVLEKNGDDQLDRACKKRISIAYSQGGQDYPIKNKKEKG